MRNLLVPFVDKALQALKASGALKLESMPSYKVDPTKDAAHGDFAVNVAMVIAKPEGKQPRQIAELVAAELRKHADIAKVDVAGAGYVNVTLKDSVVQRVAREVIEAGASYGRKPAKSTGKKVMVEYVSANPTGPIHIGHARGAFTGDAIARLVEAAGHDVTREFYTNDYGNQVEILGRTVHKRYRELFGEKIELVEGEYPAQYVVDIAQKLKDEDGDRWLKSDAWMSRCVEIAIRENIAAIKATLKKANIEHDVFTSEASIHASGKVRAVVDYYQSRGVTYEADIARGTEDKKRREGSKAAQFADRQKGGTWLETSKAGDTEDRVILRHDGTTVYLTADLAYHKDKFDRGFDACVDVLGADHRDHVQRVQAGVKLLGYANKMDFVLVQMVRITRDGQEVKVSKRKGTVFELDDLIDEVGPDVCRFIFLSRTANSQFDFDLGAVAKQSTENPVFYFQYGHARCAGILRKAGDLKPSVDDKALARLSMPEELGLLKKVALFPDAVIAAADSREPHRVLTYCGELIADFHSYYTKGKTTGQRVISDDKTLTEGRLALIAAVKQVLKNAFAMIGVDAPEQMASLAEAED
jgi:arginyl-tRNA synthetase